MCSLKKSVEKLNIDSVLDSSERKDFAEYLFGKNVNLNNSLNGSLSRFKDDYSSGIAKAKYTIFTIVCAILLVLIGTASFTTYLYPTATYFYGGFAVVIALGVRAFLSLDEDNRVAPAWMAIFSIIQAVVAIIVLIIFYLKFFQVQVMDLTEALNDQSIKYVSIDGQKYLIQYGIDQEYYDSAINAIFKPILIMGIINISVLLLSCVGVWITRYYKDSNFSNNFISASSVLVISVLIYFIWFVQEACPYSELKLLERYVLNQPYLNQKYVIWGIVIDAIFVTIAFLSCFNFRPIKRIKDCINYRKALKEYKQSGYNPHKYERGKFYP